MLKYVIAMINASLPPVLVLAAFVGLYEIRMGAYSKKPVRAGFWIGVLASAALVILKKNTGFVVREYYNLGVLLPTLLAEAPLVLFIRFPAGSPLSGAWRKAFAAVSALAVALWTAFSLPDVLFFPFDFGVGMDTVFNTLYAYKVIGYSIGVALALLAFSAAAAIARQLPPARAKSLFLALLLVFIGRQALAVLQILLGRNLIRRTPALVGFTIGMLNRIDWFLFALMGICAACALAVYVKNRFAVFQAANPALTRKLRATARRQRRWCGALGFIFAVALLSVTVGAAYENREVTLEPPRAVAVRDGKILLPLEMIDDGKLHRFKYDAPDGTEIRYIVIRKNETAFGVGLDACDICGASGYYERNDQVICILCDVVMNKSTIGFPGGCNPVPLAYRVEDGHMRIETRDLEKDAWRFKE
ncbi:MAG: Fe-S-containing protein [Planctomycetota bacterium]|jgi:uncharacterized membrane protein|nr:Fe-S-containing protein [Planctomycetota bacterium]